VLKSAEDRYKFPEDNPFVDSDEEGEVKNFILFIFNSAIFIISNHNKKSLKIAGDIWIQYSIGTVLYKEHFKYRK
jgi:hypothetical protein